MVCCRHLRHIWLCLALKFPTLETFLSHTFVPFQPVLLSPGAVLTSLSYISLILLHPLRFQSIYWTLLYEGHLWIAEITVYLSSFLKTFFCMVHLHFKEDEDASPVLQVEKLMHKGTKIIFLKPGGQVQKQSLSPSNPLAVLCPSDASQGLGDPLIARARLRYSSFPCSVTNGANLWCHLCPCHP